MKALLLSLVIIVASSFTTPDKTSKKIIKILKSGDLEDIDQYYITKDEFTTLLANMDPKPPEEQTTKMIENFDPGKEAFLEAFKKNIALVDWNKANVDSLNYDYIIAKPGSDEKILWPDSKDYQLNDTDLVKVSMLFYLHDGTNNYSMKLEMMNYKGDWKFIFWLKPPFVLAL